MNQRPNDEFKSPLDEVLENLPQEDPSEDLKDRCLSAIRGAEEQARQPRKPTWFVAMKSAAAVAAAFMLLVAVATLKWPSFMPTKKAPPELARATESRVMVEEPAPPTGPRAAPDAYTTTLRLRSDVIAESDAHQKAGTELRLQRPEGKIAIEAEAQPRALPSPDAGSGETFSTDARDMLTSLQPAAPARPWRDMSAERQKVTTKTMELEVEDVEDAYDRATSIIEKAEGYVDSEDMRLEEGGERRAHISARIPVDRLDGVVAQLRELGETIKLIGQSEDRTKEYYSRGGDIRDLGAKEVELVEKYMKERNKYRKQQLYQEIMALRGENKRQKVVLDDLSERTHYALLELTLTEAAGPQQFFGDVLRNAGTTAGWLAVTAIFWLPILLIVWAIARRRRADAA